MKKIILFILMGFSLSQPKLLCQSWLNSIDLGGEGTVSTIDAINDSENNLYIFGYFDQSLNLNDVNYITNGGRDYFLVKYDKGLNFLWVRTIGGVSNEFVLGSICISNENNVYITGSFSDKILFTNNDSIMPTGGFDTFIASYSKEGDFLWGRNVAYGPSNQRSTGIIIDSENNLLLTGFFNNEVDFGTQSFTSNGANDAYILKLDRNGNYLSSKEVDALNSNIRIFDIAATDAGYYFSGIYSDSVSFDIDTLISVSSTLDVYLYRTNLALEGQWVNNFSGAGLEYCYSIDVDNDGNVFLGGYSNSTNLNIDSLDASLTKNLIGGYDAYVTNYSSDGTLNWFRNYGWISDDQLFDIKEFDDQLYITGLFSDELIWNEDTLRSNGVNDNSMFIGNIDPQTGARLKSHSLNGQENYQERGRNVLITDEGVYSLLAYASDSLMVGDNTFYNNSPGTLKTIIAQLGCLPITLNTQTSTPLPCNTLNGGDSAQISLSAEGGFTELLYSIDGGQNFSADTIFYVNTPGEYPVVVQDSTGCQVLGDTITITQPDVLEIVSIDSADASSQGAADGSIVVEVQGGTKPYSYNLNEGAPQTDSAFTDLAQGKYKFFVQDANNCGPLETDSITIGPPPCEPISFISQTASDFACNVDGIEDSVMINVEAEGGLTGLIYSIDGGLNFAADGEFYVKDAGEYEVVVQDSTGCELLGDTLVVNQPELFTITDIDSADASARDALDGSIVATVTGGTEPYEFTLNGGTPQANGEFTGLAPEKYKLAVQDANTCGPLETDSITIGPRPCEPISLVSLDYSDLSCHENNGGEPAPISIEAEGGLTGLLYSIDGGDTFAPDADFTVGLPGDYIVMAKDSTGCEEIFDTITISQPEEFDITSIYSSHVNHHGGDDGFILVNVVGGTLPYVFTLNGGSEQSTGSYMDLTAGKYQVKVVDANNCGPLETDSIIIEQPPVGLKDLGVKQVNVYPNPVNEELNIEFKIQDKEEESISIMDASGKVVVNKKYKAINGKINERLDVSGLRNGVYFLRIGDGGDVLKIVKE